ncbi:hypothetical protein [Stenotrophomonas nitritireducens]|uniref:hypothetical protein n=1 Tax=Stenotrophomonas nitritireducens TaxID=83617 RepID=UPI003D983E6D
MAARGNGASCHRTCRCSRPRRGGCWKPRRCAGPNCARALAQLKRQLGSGAPELQARLADWQRFQRRVFDAPASLLPDGGYGIVQPDELAALERALARHDEEGQARWQALHATAGQALPPAQREELERTRQRGGLAGRAHAASGRRAGLSGGHRRRS